MRNKTNRSSKRIYLGWPMMTISLGIGGALFSYVTFFATDFMGLSAASVGLIFMLSKIADAFTDLLGAFLIERTNLKLGKGRPWQLGIIGYWICGALIFAAPEMSKTLAYIYLFVLYFLVYSVFLTMVNCSELVYFSNVIDDEKQSISLLSVNGFISMICGLGASIILPQIVKNLDSRQGWMIMGFCITIPGILFGVLRVILVKEKHQVRMQNEKSTPLDMLKLLKENKYALLFSAMLLIANIGTTSTSTVNTYFALYVYHDIGIGSLLSAAMLVVVVAIVIEPWLAKKMGFERSIRVFTLLGAAGYLIRLIDIHSLPLLLISNIFASLGFYVLFLFANNFGLDCIDYGEWKTGVRSEGIVGAVQSFTGKLGTAFGSGFVGVLMGLAGYNGALNAQPGSAVTMIVLLFSVIPAIFCLAVYILLRKYDLEDKLPDIRKELDERRQTK